MTFGDDPSGLVLMGRRLARLAGPFGTGSGRAEATVTAITRAGEWAARHRAPGTDGDNWRGAGRCGPVRSGGEGPSVATVRDHRRTYTRSAVTAQNIAQALAYINWVVLCSLALGAFSLAWSLRQLTDVTKGFVSFTTGTAAVLGLLLYFSDQSLPAPTLIKVTAAPELDMPRRVAILVFTLLAFVVCLRARGGHRSWWLGVGTIGAGTVMEGLAAIGWAGDALHGVPLLVQ